MSERKVYKPKPVSGFPEWLPEVRLIEQQWFDHIRRVFESYGFCNIETPSVEELEVIAAKGEVDKEIYVIERLHKEEGDKEARLALHFDQTVPLARYVAQHFNELVFPFKRYQMQRVWRGERPQAGRFREFYQCDIDVINIDALPLHFDAEMPAIIWEVLSGLPGMENEKIQLRVSNRKILMGLLDAVGIADKTAVTRIIDKGEKIGRDKAEELLKTECSLSAAQIEKIVPFLSSPRKRGSGTDGHQTPAFAGMTALNEQMQEGLNELSFVMDQLKHLPPDAVVADISIVRGLDYYTGTVYETVFTDDPGYGSICSGGRYDDLASSYINKKLPGVGISIGFSRLFARMVEKKAFSTAQKSPADVLMILPSEEQRAMASQTAQKLRARGVKVELFHAPKKIPDQLKYASRKGIPFVWFPPFESGKPHEVKDMATGEQKQADPESWQPSPLTSPLPRAGGGIKGGGIAALLAATWLLAFAPPARAADYAYAPENCEFRMTFPGEPYKTRRCQTDAPDVCREMTSYTKVFGIDATVNINVTCNKAEDQMYERYSGDVMQATLAAIMGENHLEDYQTGYQEFDVAKQAVLMGMGKTGSTDKIFIAQLWIGHKSVLSVEAELVGGPLDEADKMFSDILHSIRHESWGKDGPAKKDDAPAADKSKTKPAEKTGDKPVEKTGKKQAPPSPAADAAPQDKKPSP